MWRWLSGLPRAIRHHLHGPRASASGVCKEDELDEAKKCAESCHQHYRGHYRLGAGPHYQERSHDDNQWDQWDQGAGPDREKGYRHAPNFWTLFCGPGSCEAFGLGTIVVVSLHLTKYHLLIDRWEKLKDKDKRSQCLLYKIKSVLPQPCLLRKSVLGTNKTPSSDENRTSPVPDLYERHGLLWNSCIQDVKNLDKKTDNRDVAKKEDLATRTSLDPLETVMKDFETVCRKYAAIGQNIAGLKKAMAGQLNEAANHWAEASSSAYGKASFNLGLCYETGRGVKKNMKQAVKLYERAARENHCQAMYNLALLYLGEGLASPTRALQLMEQAADLGLAKAQTYMGVHIMEQEEPCLDRAVAYFRAAAGQDDSDGEYFLALCYEQGLGVEENKCRAADLYSQAATKGHDGATYNLAVFHEHGLGGLPEDRVTAMTLYRKAADAGNESALCYLEGPCRPTSPNWKEQYMYDFVEEPQLEVRVPKSIQVAPPTVQIPSSYSSPSLTDYVRKHLENMHVEKDVLQLDVASMSILQPQFVGSKKSSIRKDKGVFFTVGTNDSNETGGAPLWADIDDMWEQNVMKDKSHFSVMLQRNNTMPDVRSITCS